MSEQQFKPWWGDQPDSKIDMMSPTQVASLAWHAGRDSTEQNTTECWEAADARIATLTAERDAANARIAELEAIVEKYPHTGDKHPVYPGMKVYPKHPIEAGDHGVIEIALYDPLTGNFHRHGTDGFRTALVFATPAAAKEAADDRSV